MLPFDRFSIFFVSVHGLPISDPIENQSETATQRFRHFATKIAYYIIHILKERYIFLAILSGLQKYKVMICSGMIIWRMI